MITRFRQDLKEYKKFPENRRKSAIWILSHRDYAQIIAAHRIREIATENKIPLVNHILRRFQSVIYGIEIGSDVSIGYGARFVHPIGITIGGNSQVGNRVTFFGTNTVGTASENGYPVIGDDVIIGAGAKIIGPVKIGNHSTIGANSIVNKSAPDKSTLVGVPARQLNRYDGKNS
jgi:serine O-acetyltransferase